MILKYIFYCLNDWHTRLTTHLAIVNRVFIVNQVCPKSLSLFLFLSKTKSRPKPAIDKNPIYQVVSSLFPYRWIVSNRSVRHPSYRQFWYNLTMHPLYPINDAPPCTPLPIVKWVSAEKPWFMRLLGIAKGGAFAPPRSIFCTPLWEKLVMELGC